jgi:hypothetical protein
MITFNGVYQVVSAKGTKHGRALASALLLLTTAPAAQADPGGVPEALNQVSKTLSSLIATVSGLASKVAELTSAVATISSAPSVLATSMLSTSRVDQKIDCRVSNIGPTPAQVTVTVFDPIGASPPVVLNLPAGNTQIVAASNFGDTLIYRACRFTSSNAPLSQLRANAVVRGTNLEIFAVSEAR